MRLPLILIITLLISGCFGIGKGTQLGMLKTNYKIYNNRGVATDFDSIIKAALSADVLFIGEAHNDSVAHKMEVDLFKTLHKKLAAPSTVFLKKKVTLSLEFFEKDVQVSLDEYLQGLITEKHFRDSTRAWPNYQKDYRALIEYAKANCIAVIAANAPRRYVNLVSRQGRNSLNGLSDEAKNWLPPLPYGVASDAYKEKLDKLNQTIIEKMKTGRKKETAMKKIDSDKPESLIPPYIDHNAQSLWDASMAWSISESLNQSPDTLVININGNFHSENKLGIPEHLLMYRPATKIVVVTIKPVDDFPEIAETTKRSDDFIVYSIVADAR